MTMNRSLINIKQNYFVLKLREINHRLTYKNKYKRMSLAMEKFHKCNSKKSAPQIKKEINLLKKYWGCYPLHYYRYELYRKDRNISENQLLDYIPEFFFYAVFLPYYNSKKYSILVLEKNITEALFRSININQPNTLCKLINGNIYTKELLEVNFENIEKEIIENNISKIFVKPVDERGGNGILVFNKINSRYYTTRDNIIFDQKLLNNISKDGDYIVQYGLEQDDEISSIYPKSINTFRIVTENKNGKVKVLCAVLRLGRNGSEIDNSSQGGIVIKIDVNSGDMGKYGITASYEKIHKHPNSGFIFEENKIKKWDKIIEFTKGCAIKLPQFTYLGWDIALTKEGPVAIETNLAFAIDSFQTISGGLRESFSIDNPQDYWKKISNTL